MNSAECEGDSMGWGDPAGSGESDGWEPNGFGGPRGILQGGGGLGDVAGSGGLGGGLRGPVGWDPVG